MVKKILILIAIFSLLALSATGVNALTLSENSAETCATDTSIFLFTVSNTANFENAYTVSFSDSAGKWAIAAPQGFSLKPGQSETVYVYVTPSISASPGIYPLKITLSSVAGTETATAVITVKDCHSASLKTSASAADVCSATEAVYPLTLQNTGKYTENFALSISGVPAKWSTISEELVRLEAGQVKDIIVSSVPPADQTGNFALTITAASQNSEALASADLKLSSKGCYDFSAAADANYVSFCENSEAKIPLAVENKGSVDNSYSVSVEGPVWSTVENKNLDIPSSQAKFTNVVLFPGFGVAGNFKIKVIVTPETGDAQEQIIMASVRSCHDMSLDLATAEDTICPHTSKVYAVSLVNNGEFAERYALTVTGADYASLDKDFVDLAAGNSTEFNLLVEPKDVNAETKTITVMAKAQEPSHASATSALKLTVAPISSCYGVQATAAITRVNVAAGEPAVVPIIIENKGIENSTYNLDVSGTGAQFIQLNPASIKLNGKTAKTIYAYVAVPDQTAEDTYKATVSARLADGTVSSTTTFDIVLGTSEQPAAEKPITEGTSRGRLIAIKDRIVEFFKSIGERITAVQRPHLGMPNLNLSSISLPKFGTKETATENETNKTNETEGNVSGTENITTEENITIEENQTEEQNLTEEIILEENKTTEHITVSENISKFLSPEAAAKLSAENKTGGFKLSMPKISMPSISIPSLGFVKGFLTQSTYYIPNWLFIIVVIVIVAILSYILRKKDFAKKFNEFLEEDTEEKKPEGPQAQDILDEVAKAKKENKKPARRKRKK
jgi:uncharacterized membrane protein